MSEGPASFRDLLDDDADEWTVRLVVKSKGIRKRQVRLWPPAHSGTRAISWYRAVWWVERTVRDLPKTDRILSIEFHSLKVGQR